MDSTFSQTLHNLKLIVAML